MSLVDRIFGAIRYSIQLNTEVKGIAADLKSVAPRLNELDRRLIRVETTLELATRGAFAAMPRLPDDNR